MTFNLKVITIETKPRAGYYLLHNNNFHVVKKVVPQRNEVKLDNDEILTIEEASKKVAKLIGEVTIPKEDKDIVKTYSVIHGDYTRIIDGLYNKVPYSEDVPEEERKFTTMKEALFAGVHIQYEGEFETILTRTVQDEVVNITSLAVVDKHELYRKEDRIGVVTKFDNASHVFTIKLNTTGIEVKCKREDFSKIHNDNVIQMLHAKCNICNR